MNAKQFKWDQHIHFIQIAMNQFLKSENMVKNLMKIHWNIYFGKTLKKMLYFCSQN